MRLLLANLGLFAAYSAVTLGFTWLEVRGPTICSQLVELFIPFLFTSAIPVACYVNWLLLRIEDATTRLAAGVGLGLVVVAISVIPFFVIQLHFFFEIGGTP